MEMRTRSGGIVFELVGAALAWWPGPPLRPFAFIEEEAVEVAAEAARSYLVIDHRAERDLPGHAHVELWRPLGAVEGELAGMFVLCDPAGGVPSPAPGSSLVALARQLSDESQPPATFYAAVAAAKFANYERPPHSPV